MKSYILGLTLLFCLLNVFNGGKALRNNVQTESLIQETSRKTSKAHTVSKPKD
jgi:hypothetical protein